MFTIMVATRLDDQNTWFLDSGCTQHMTSKHEYFTKLESAKGLVKLADKSKLAVVGKGTVAIEAPKGTKFIQDVLLVPELDQNLLSVGQMLEQDYILLFNERKCVVSEPSGQEVITVEMIKRSFPMNWNSNPEQACRSSRCEQGSKLWHKRFGHYNLKSIQYAQKHDLVKDLPEIELCSDVCESCQLGKQHRLPFPKLATWRASEKLQLIHSDICGPMKTPSLNGSKYFNLFIDDLTRMTWVYFLKQKLEVFAIFKKFKAFCETQKGCLLRTLRTDNGKEYTSSEFQLFCDDMGVEHHLTVTYSPQQNGVSERKNRYVLEMARRMIFEKNLPKSFWAEAVNTSIYLQNRLPTTVVDGMTPIEAWSDKKPSIRHPKVLGSLYYTHVPAVKRSKLDEKAEKGILVGYSSICKGYRIYNIESGKVFISKDVKVDEDAYWDWNISQVRKMVVEPAFQDSNEDLEAENDEDFSVGGTRPLAEIYERCNLVVLEPSNFQYASEIEKWKQTMKEEIAMIEKNETWKLVDKPENKQVIGVKWVYRVKFNADGSINKHKARLVAKGYCQQPGVDYSDTFAPVASMDTIRILIALAAQMKWKSGI